MPKKLTKEQFIEKASNIFCEYDYSKFNYINYKTKGEIICKKHGSFYKTPEKILVQKERCPKCNLEEKIKVEVDLKRIYPDGTNYRKEYINLLKKSTAKEGELHHILPKSMFPKWKKRKSNIVKLSYEDHFKAHYLLYKIYDNYEMTIALFLMLKITEKDNNLKLYKEIKEKQIRKSFKAIYCVEDDRIFDSILEAQTVYNSSKEYLGNVSQ